MFWIYVEKIQVRPTL